MRRQSTQFTLRGVIILCVISGALLSLCFPPVRWWPLAWVALIPWLVALRMGSGGGAFLGSWIGGVVFFGALLSWFELFGVSVWALMAIIQGASLMLAGLLIRRASAFGPMVRMLGTGVLWTAIEWVRGLGEFGFTWGWLGYSQSPVLPILPLARFAGALGLSFVIVAVNAALAEIAVALVRKELRFAAVGRSLVVMAALTLCIMGAREWAARHPANTGVRVRVAVIQGSAHGPLRAADVNTPLTTAEQDQMLNTYSSLTRHAAQLRPALVIWPESSIPGEPEKEPWIAARMGATARASNAWLLAGGPYTDELGRQFNSAYLYSPTGYVTARYDKVHLVPFGEYVPARARLPFLNRYHVRAQDFSAGAIRRVLQAGTISLGPMICFESIFPTISWELAKRNVEILVIITNDAWFGHTAAAAQHEQISVLRAVETGCWVLRAASCGISAIISPEGRIVAEAGLFKRSVLSAEIQLVDQSQTPWLLARVFGWLMFALTIGIIIASAALPRRRKGAAIRSRSRPQQPARATPL